mgnify:CR=1 FL=1|jgi:hypothetical protein
MRRRLFIGAVVLATLLLAALGALISLVRSVLSLRQPLTFERSTAQ